MKKILSELYAQFEKLCLYAGVGQEQFDRYYVRIHDQIRHENKDNLGVFSMLASIVYACILAVSLCGDALSRYTTLYAAMLIFSVLTMLLNKLLHFKSNVPLRIGVYVFVFANYLFSILLGTVYSPMELATTFSVLTIAAPLIFVDRPINFCFLNLLAYAVFVLFAVIFKDKACLMSDMVNAAVFILVSMVACVFTMNLKLQKFMLEYINRIASETDILTGLYNRKRFENTLADFTASYCEDTYFLYLDVNGLHELNDQFGHEAGDKMLCHVAAQFRDRFGENTFRIGGDEYVTFGMLLSEETLEERVEGLQNAVEEAGYSVSVGFEFGTKTENMKELMRLAERKMYDAKAEYYLTSGKERRRR